MSIFAYPNPADKINPFFFFILLVILTLKTLSATKEKQAV